ncbi:MAG: hypothetical protein AB9866_27435 [Syntrophobacteraceae bacterium]
MGLPASDDIGRIISRLAGIGLGDSLQKASLKKRVEEAFSGIRINSDLLEAFQDLLLLLFDGDESKSDNDAIRLHRKKVKDLSQKYSREYSFTLDEKERFEHYLASLHQIYDWVGVRGIARYIARKWDSAKQKHDSLTIMNLLTTIDHLYESNLAMPTEDIFSDAPEAANPIYIMDKHRLLATKRCLAHLTSTIQRIVLQDKPGKINKTKLEKYWRIARDLAALMNEEAQVYANRGYQRDRRKFYYYSYALVSFNWDPIMLWLIFHAHKKLNDNPTFLNRSKLRLFNDLGDGIGIRKILSDDEKDDDDLLAFTMNEAICKRINDLKYQGGDKSRIIRIGKLLFPHAGLGWRVCPRCGKLFTDFGPRLGDIDSSVAFGPDLLPELNVAWKHRTAAEEEAIKEGEFGGIQCIFCASMTKPYDSPLILQSIIKSERHYVLEGIFRDMGLVVGNAKHLVFAGYSMPQDDYIYRCFFQAAWAGSTGTRNQKFCTLVNYDPDYVSQTGGNTVWLEGKALTDYLKSQKAKPDTKEIINRMLELFDISRLRVSLLGIPGTVTDIPGRDPKEALTDLLYPKQCFPEGFPPERETIATRI